MAYKQTKTHHKIAAIENDDTDKLDSAGISIIRTKL